MNNRFCALLCCRINYKKWRRNPRIFSIFSIIFIFQSYSFSPLSQICAYYEVSTTPWVFPFFMGNPSFFIIYGALAMLLYCDAPFLDEHASFLLIRAGRKNWILGQLLYIYSSSFLYTMCHVVSSILVLIPHLTFSLDWGMMLRTIANQSDIFERVGVRGSFSLYKEFLAVFSPIQAMGLSILLFWLGTGFIGVLILCFHLIKEMSGLVISGVFTSFAYFSSYLGAFSLGAWLCFFSPVTWSCISYLVDWNRIGNIPSIRFAIMAYLVMIGVMSVVSVQIFCKKDIVIQGER